MAMILLHTEMERALIMPVLNVFNRELKERITVLLQVKSLTVIIKTFLCYFIKPN